MVPGEQITGTRDEHYSLVSVLYRALHAAEAMEAYILDAEAVDDERLASFFREAQVMQRRLTERVKGMLGILEVSPESGVAPDLPPEGGLSPGEVSGGIRPEGVVSDVPAEVTTGRVEPEDFDPTTSALRDGIENFAIRRALSEIDGWEQKLEESSDPQLAPIAESLRQRRALLTADRLDGGTIGMMMGVLGEQVDGVASGRASATSCGNWASCSPLRDAPSPIGVDRRAW